MRIEIISRSQASQEIRQSLLLPIGTNLDSDEGLCAMIRSVGAMRTPCRSGKIVSEVADLLRHVVDEEISPERLQNLLEDLVAYGDFVSVANPDGDSSEMLYRGQPAFLFRSSGDALLIGLDLPGQQSLGEDLQYTIQLHRHSRIVKGSDGLRVALLDSGLLELSANQWLGLPKVENHSAVVAAALGRLNRTPEQQDISGVTIIDHQLSVRYYTGRKRPLTERDTGVFVARRPRQYGADGWCLVEVQSGKVLRLLDFPGQGKTRPCDQAWLLQAAIDRDRGQPQILAVTDLPGSRARLSVFSPIPGWLQRRWEAVAVPASTRRALLAFDFEREILQEEIDFARDAFFLEPVLEDS